MNKWYNTEVANGIEDKKLKLFLKANGIKFDSSGAGNMVHFEIFASEADLQKVNKVIDLWED